MRDVIYSQEEAHLGINGPPDRRFSPLAAHIWLVSAKQSVRESAGPHSINMRLKSKNLVLKGREAHESQGSGAKNGKERLMHLQLCGKWQSVEAHTITILKLARRRGAPKVWESNGRGYRQTLITHRSGGIFLNGRYFDQNSTPVASHLTAAEMTRS